MARDETLLAEYAALRAEVERRAGIQWNVFALQLTSAGAIASLAIAATSRNTLLLLIPLSSYMLGNRYILHDYHLRLISRYIRESLSGRLGDQLVWEDWKAEHADPAQGREGPLTAITWNVIHPTRLAFEGIGVLALTSALAAGIHRWQRDSLTWTSAVGLILLWLLDALAMYFLHRAFDRSRG